MSRSPMPLHDGEGIYQGYTDEEPCPVVPAVGRSVVFHIYHFVNYCGAWVCDGCGGHYGLAMCFCGWKEGGAPLTQEDRAELEAET